MRRASLLLAAVILFAVTAQTAAAETSRDEYRERVDPICKANAEANERILAGVQKRVSRGQLGAAAHQFVEAADALKKTRAQLLAVPMPGADSAKLTRWLGDVKTEVGLLELIGRKLGAGDKMAAQKAVVKLSQNANQANAEVLSFEFRYCRFEPSKYT